MRRRKRVDGDGEARSDDTFTFQTTEDDPVNHVARLSLSGEWLFGLFIGSTKLHQLGKERRWIYLVSVALVSFGLLLGLFLFIHHVIFGYFPCLHPRYLFERVGRSKYVTNNEAIQEIQNHFPVHIGEFNGSDWESIRHPGFALADQEALNALLADRDESIPRTLQVPKFWNPPEYGSKGVRYFLGQNGEYIVSPQEARSVGSYYNGMETIFVALASYRDPECLPTVQDLYDRAKYPERIRVGVVDQRVTDKQNEYGGGGDQLDPSCTTPKVPCSQDPSQSLCLFSHLIDSIDVPAQFMVGPTFARHLAYRLYRGEFYALQVDSHLRFVQDWDVDIIEQWKSTQNEMGVLSTYLSDITRSIDDHTHESLRSSRSIMCRIEYEWKGGSMAHIKNGVQPCNPPKLKTTPMLQPFWAAGFSFARGHFIVQVPYDQYLPMVFQGEEISMAIRGFTFGYDYYAPSRHVAFHIYAIRDNAFKRKNVKTFTENEVLFPGAKIKAYRRLNGIIGMGAGARHNLPSDGSMNNNVGATTFFDEMANVYGVGTVRSPQNFFQTFGIHVDEQEIEEDLCDFVQGTHGGKSMHERFTPYMRYDGMGIDYRILNFQYKKIERHDTEVSDEELKQLRDLLRRKQAADVAKNAPANVTENVAITV